MAKLLVFEADENASKLAKIANLLGIESSIITKIPAEPQTLILPAQLYEQHHAEIASTEHRVYLYNAGASPLLSDLLEPFAYQPEAIQITANDRAFTRYLSNLSFSSASPQMVFPNKEEFSPIILADEYPILVKWRGFYLSATPDIADLDTLVPKNTEPQREYFSSLIPIILFIKWAFKEQAWHLSNRAACITIDDPLLQPSYGFIHFDRFQKWLERNRFAATFAFIPWNYKRSHQKVVQLFKEHPEQLSICVHGCNHTNREFAETNPEELRKLGLTALAKMVLHQKITGLPYDNIMIFPQGKFSEEAFEVLGFLGYKAAVNSGVFATNYQNTLSIRDVLDLTVQSASGLPLYRRRYPTDLFDFACDLLLEKPIIITQHHDDFREGYQALEDFIKQLEKLEPQLQWMPLNDVLDSSNWEKLDANGNLVQRKADPRPSSEPPLLENEMLQLESVWKEDFGIAVRRYLLEFRDEVIHTNPLLTKLMQSLLNFRKPNRQKRYES